ncbi:MAG: TonB-dependent receptor [Gemmatimonadales bacterium]|nr:MAG: TonB-dependent receptor [Gemmatimonadales bacterium]
MSGRASFPVLVASLLLASGSASALAAQTGTITGTVADEGSEAPLTGADLILEGTGLSGVSGSDGRFELAAIPAGEHVLRVERIGYRPLRETVRVSPGETVVLHLALAPQPVALEEVAVTDAVGERRLREVGHTVARLEIDEVTDRPATLSEFLQGAAVGVEVTGGSGEAGQGRQIRLRGNASMVLSNQPLVYIDGVRMMEGAFPSEVFEQPGSGFPTGANVTTSPLDLVSIGDIDRIEVVKGPSATTLFGTGASNGVIQIFTRRGESGPPRWAADISQGTGWVRPFGAHGVDYLYVESFLRHAWWGRGYDGGEASGECVTDDPRWGGANRSPEGPCRWPGSQWYQTYRLAVSGGSDRIDYHAAAEHQNDRYALPLDRLERYNVRTNIGASISPRVDARLQAAYSSFWTSNTVSGSTLEGIFLSSIRQERNALSSADPRDIARLLENRNDQWIDRLTGGLQTTFSQSARASHRLMLGYDFSRQDLRSLRPEGVFPPNAFLTTRRWDRHLRTVDYVGRYEFVPGPDLRSTLSLGAQLISDDLDWRVRSGVGFAGEPPTDPAAADSTVTIHRSGSATTTGLFGQHVLALLDRYFLTTGLRIDRHAARGESFVRFDPRVGFTWAMGDEAFWPESLGALRLRSAWGRSSTAAGPFVQSVRYWGGAAPDDSPPGPVLEPEANSEWEVGLDWSLLEGRMTMGLTRYVQTTKHALVPVSEETDAFPQRRELHNLGKIRTRGIELQLDAALVSTPDWALQVGLGVTTNHSTALDLGGVERFDGLGAGLLEGHPVPVSIGRRVADPDAVHGPWSPNRYLTDEEGNSIFPLGPQLPTRFVNPSLSARLPGGIRFAARGEYRGGNVRRVNPVPVSRGSASPLCFPYYEDVRHRTLRPDAPDLWQERCTATAASDYWFRGDYFRLRSVAAAVPVGFAFPDRIDDAVLTVTLANAYTWHREVPWWDLEILGNAGANDDGLGSSDRVPAPTTLSFALRVRF